MNAKTSAIIALLLAAVATSCAFRQQEDTSALCSEYCDTVEENCDADPEGFTEGLFQIDGKFSRAECLEVCEDLPDDIAPDDEAEFEASGFAPNDDNVQCRIYHANNAALNAALHCPHAGESGSGVCVAFTENCKLFCDGVVEPCQGEPGAPATAEECKVLCRGLSDDALQCRNDVLANSGTIDGGQSEVCARALGQTDVCD